MKTDTVKQLANQLSTHTSEAVNDTLGVIRNRPLSSSLIGAICLCAGALFLIRAER